MSQGQLWDAGPVMIRPTSHKAGKYRPVPTQCQEILPDGTRCPKPRRLAQGARYCEDHARSKGYLLASTGPAEVKTCIRSGCEKQFSNRRAPRHGNATAWYELCPDCRNDSPLTISQLRDHHVPYDLAIDWLCVGSQLLCGLCGKTLARKALASQPVIDHDRQHCQSGSSCGQCVRGVLCRKCNTHLGHLEALQAAGLLDAAVEWVKSPA
jgi:Recombination endonuclease VII